jgi:hypothetical protein
MEITCSNRQLEPLVGAVEAAEYLGFAPLTIRRMARRGILPSIAFPMGDTGKYMHKFRMSDLEAYVKTLEHKIIVPAPKDVPILPLENLDDEALASVIPQGHFGDNDADGSL